MPEPGAPGPAGRRMTGIRELKGEADFDAVRSLPQAVVYKHSPRCGQSAWARREMESLAEGRDVAVVQVDVVRQRTLSKHIAARLGVRHQSPQVIVLRDGAVAWHASHGGVRADDVAEALEGAADGR